MTTLTRTASQALSPLGVRTPCKSYTSLVIAAPSAELQTSEHTYTLRVALPGVQRHSLRAHVKENTLTVSGAWEGAGPGGAVLFGEVYRAASLPADAQPARLELRLEVDALIVRVPRLRVA